MRVHGTNAIEIDGPVTTARRGSIRAAIQDGEPGSMVCLNVDFKENRHKCSRSNSAKGENNDGRASIQKHISPFHDPKIQDLGKD